MAAILRTTPEEGTAGGDGDRPARAARPSRTWLAWAAVLALWLAFTLPLATGERTLFFRDVLGNHFAVKAFGAEALARGEIPAFNPTLGMGQPFRGNPSALAFYPGNLLYLLLPFWSAFNLHYALHWLLALLSMYALARRLGQRREAALLAALTWAGGGYVLSALSFYNVLTVVAWWPLAMVGAVRGGARGVALGGAACGMALLGGEPLTATLGMVPLLLAAVRRHGGWRGLGTAFGVGVVGLLVALPQVVATLRILGFSARGNRGLTPDQVAGFALHPLRLLELLVPLPFGWPLDVGPHGWILGETAPDLSYFLSLYVGLPALWLALSVVRRRAGWAALAGLGLALSLLGGLAPEVLLAATGGLFRYPEKFLLWYALALPLLAGWGLERGLERPGGRARAALAVAGLLAAGALSLTVLGPRFVATFPYPERAVAHVIHWFAYLALGALLLAAAAVALRRRGAVAVVVLQLAALLQLFPLARTAPTAPLRQAPPWVERLGAGTAVVNSLISKPPWEPYPQVRVEPGTRAVNRYRNARDLYPATGVRHGLTYPLAPDIEGLSSALHSFLSVEITRLGWPGRVAWMRTTGVEAAVLYSDPGVPGLTPLDRQEEGGMEVHLFRVDDPAPAAWWPRAVLAASGPYEALLRVAELDDPTATVFTSRPVAHNSRGAVRLDTEDADRLVLEVESPDGGLAVVRRAYHPLWEAHVEGGPRDGEELDLLPAQLTLLGAEVPPGEHTVTVGVDDRPLVAAAGGSLFTLLALLVVVGCTGRRRPAAADETPDADPTPTGAEPV